MQGASRTRRFRTNSMNAFGEGNILTRCEFQENQAFGLMQHHKNNKKDRSERSADEIWGTVVPLLNFCFAMHPALGEYSRLVRWSRTQGLSLRRGSLEQYDLFKDRLKKFRTPERPNKSCGQAGLGKQALFRIE